MLRCALLGGLIVALAVWPSRAFHAGDQKAEDNKAWQQAELKKLAGRWTTVRQERIGPDKTRRRRVDLVFADGELTVLLFSENDTQQLAGSLKVMGLEKLANRHLMPFRLLLDRGEVFYDLLDEKLIVVGRIMPRPWEGFPLSGEFQRSAQPK